MVNDTFPTPYPTALITFRLWTRQFIPCTTMRHNQLTSFQTMWIKAIAARRCHPMVVQRRDITNKSRMVKSQPQLKRIGALLNRFLIRCNYVRKLFNRYVFVVWSMVCLYAVSNCCYHKWCCCIIISIIYKLNLDFKAN